MVGIFCACSEVMVVTRVMVGGSYPDTRPAGGSLERCPPTMTYHLFGDAVVPPKPSTVMHVIWTLETVTSTEVVASTETTETTETVESYLTLVSLPLTSPMQCQQCHAAADS